MSPISYFAIPHICIYGLTNQVTSLVFVGFSSTIYGNFERGLAYLKINAS